MKYIASSAFAFYANKDITIERVLALLKRADDEPVEQEAKEAVKCVTVKPLPELISEGRGMMSLSAASQPKQVVQETKEVEAVPEEKPEEPEELDFDLFD